MSVDPVAAGDSLLFVTDASDVSVPMLVEDLPSCASEPIQRSRGLSADDDFADIYDSDGCYDSANGYCQSNEDHLHNEDGNRADERGQCMQSNSTLDEPMDLQQEQPIEYPSLDL